MVALRPFSALRPQISLARQVASVPSPTTGSCTSGVFSDFITPTDYSFPALLQDAESCPDIDEGLRNIRKEFDHLRASSVLEKDLDPSLYVYSLEKNNHSQTGVVGCLPVDEYEANRIRKHEDTRVQMEEYCARLMLSLEAHESPVFLIYHEHPDIQALVKQEMTRKPLYDFRTHEGTRQLVWKVQETAPLEQAFAAVPQAYIADGHHRLAGASRCRKQLREANPRHTGNEEYNFCLAALFPHTQVRIHAYNRIIKQLTKDKREIIAELSKVYTVKEHVKPIPERKGECFMYLDGTWYGLLPPPMQQSTLNPVENLEVTVLYQKVLRPILGITDPRTDKNIDYVSGIRGTAELEELVNYGHAACAFCLYPTSVEELMQVSDLGLKMEPKSTWFEPKLSFGLFIHPFDQLQ